MTYSEALASWACFRRPGWSWWCFVLDRDSGELAWFSRGEVDGALLSGAGSFDANQAQCPPALTVNDRAADDWETLQE